MTGRLVLVATPIGNLQDITARAVDALRDADVICCEDTRHSSKLLQRIGVSEKTLLIVNEHTEHDSREKISALVSAGKTVALITDAGSPGISDPGERIVRAVIDAGGTVTATPGPSAAIMAVTLSGLPAGRFVFEGFLVVVSVVVWPFLVAVNSIGRQVLPSARVLAGATGRAATTVGGGAVPGGYPAGA